jgi:hypothetical protein
VGVPETAPVVVLKLSPLGSGGAMVHDVAGPPVVCDGRSEVIGIPRVNVAGFVA